MLKNFKGTKYRLANNWFSIITPFSLKNGTQ